MRRICYCYMVLLLMVGGLSAQTNFEGEAIRFDEIVVDVDLLGRYAFLGIYSDGVSPAKAKQLGADNIYGKYVTSVIDNTAASRAGIKPFDYLYGIDGYRTNQEQSLGQIIRKYEPGDKATVHLVRNHRRQTVAVIFGDKDQYSNNGARRDCDYTFLGVSMLSQCSDMPGIAVGIIENSTADAMGLRDEDRITQINGNIIRDWNDLRIAIKSTEVGADVEVRFIRGERNMQRTGQARSKCDTQREEEYAYYDFRSGGSSDGEPQEWFDRYFSEEGSRISFGQVQVRVQDVRNGEERASLRRKGIRVRDTDNLSVERLSLSANRNKQKFDLSFFLPTSGATTIQVYNRSGRMIYEYDLGDFSGTFRDEIDLAQNGTGAYYLQINQGNRGLTKQIMVMQ